MTRTYSSGCILAKIKGGTEANDELTQGQHATHFYSNQQGHMIKENGLCLSINTYMMI